ncbi:MAG: pyridoxal phosphate-dependent aminotransferase [Candidatus Latescibacteria bacterium]|nr:pyridoxal phosphate-dependent aminotransferase [Candidatus Latescibacterota bacterium]
MAELNRITASMPSSGIRKIMTLSQDVEDCIHLEVGQPDFRTPEHILVAAAQAARDGFTRYTPGAGIPELREAIARKVTEKNGFPVKAGNIVVSPGAVTSVATTLLALAEPGDEVLVPDPGWPNYMMQMTCIGATGVRYSLDSAHGFQIDFDELEKRVTPKTKVLMTTTPGNPTGAVLPRGAMENLAEFCRRHDIFLLSDEVYEDIVFDTAHTSAGLFNYDGRIATVFGFSKTYAVTGLRVGYVVCGEKMAALVTKLQEPFVSCACGISQKACLAAIEGPQEPVYEMVKIYRERRDAVVKILRENGLYRYTPQGAFYILIDISATGMDSDEFAVELLKDRNVAVAPGGTFGPNTESFIRICFATDTDRLIEGVTILCDWINERRK